MPRLDAERLALWRSLQTTANRLERVVDADLVDETDLPLAWFEVLAALQRAGGVRRVHELAEDVGAVPSSFSRRLDRLEDHAWIERRRPARAHHDRTADGRAVEVVLTREGRDVWRDANIAYRRAVQQHFARHLTESDLLAVARLLGKVAPRRDE